MRRRWSTLCCLAACVASLCWSSDLTAQATVDSPTLLISNLVDRVGRSDGLWNELGIDPEGEKAATIRNLSKDMHKEFQERFVNSTAEDEQDSKQLQLKVKSKYESELKKLLEPDQLSRLQQIEWQAQGLSSLLAPEVAEALALTTEQREKLQAAEAEYSPTAIRRAPRPARATPETADEMRRKWFDQKGKWQDRVKEILSPEQSAKYDELKGKQFVPSGRPGYVPPPSGTVVFTAPTLLIGFALREPVQKELGISAVDPVIAAIGKLSQEMRSASDVTNPKYIVVSFKLLNLKYEHKLEKLLSPEQFKRLQQINLQYLGIADALEVPGVGEAVGLNPEQRFKLREFKHASVIGFSADLAKSKDLTDADRRKKHDERRTELNRKVHDLLSKEQQAEFIQLLGPEFDVAQLRSPPAPATTPTKTQENK